MSDGRGGRGPRRGLLAACMGGEAASYGGTDVAVAVDALARTASTLQADLRSERRANEVFREGVTREQRRMRKHLEGLPLGDAELAEEGAGGSSSRTRRDGARSVSSSSSWSVTRGTSFALTLMTVAVVVLVAYAAATGGGSRGLRLTGGVAALSGRVRDAKTVANDVDVVGDVGASRLESVERGVAALREQNEELLRRLARTSLDPEVLSKEAREDVEDATRLETKRSERPANADAKKIKSADKNADSPDVAPVSLGDLAFRVSLASRAASSFAEDMDVDAQWTRRAAARLRGHTEKMTKLDEVLRASGGSGDRGARDLADVRAGVETVRMWEEKIAARFAESRARAREALDVLETLETLAAEAKKTAKASGDRKEKGATELASLRDDLEEKRAALRVAADRDAEVSGDADAALTSLRAAILRVMAAVVDERGEGKSAAFSAANGEPEPRSSRAKTLALLGAFAEFANAETAQTLASMPQPALGDAEPQPATTSRRKKSAAGDVVSRDEKREPSSLGDWYTGEPSFDPYLGTSGGSVPGSFPAGVDGSSLFAQPANSPQRVVPVPVPVAPAGYAYRPDDAATRETVAWAGDMANKLEMAQAAAEAAEEAGRAATERAADAAEAATEEARREVRAAEAAEAKAKKEAAEAKKATAKALRDARDARNDLVAARAEARAAEALLRNESGRAMEEIQAARDAIKAESARSAAAVAAAKEAEAAIPDKAARLAKRKVDDVKKRAEAKISRERASAEAVRGEIEHEVERELADAQAKIDEAREAEAEAERRREEALEEKSEAVRAAAAATRLESAAEEELAHLLELRERHESEVAMSEKEAARLERILADRVATAEDVNAEAGVAARERARIEARAAEAETLVRDAREDLEEATREQSELDAKIDDAAAVVRSREDDAERSETELRRASSEAKEAGERVRRSEKKLKRVADDALDAEAESLLDEVEEEEQEEDASIAEEEEEEAEEESAEDEDASDEEVMDDDESAEEEEKEEEEEEESTEEEEEEESTEEEESLPSKRHSAQTSSAKRHSAQTSSAKQNGASSSWTRDDAREASDDTEDLLAEWHDDYEDVAEAGDDVERDADAADDDDDETVEEKDDDAERDADADDDDDDEWSLSDFDPASPPPSEKANRRRARKSRGGARDSDSDSETSEMARVVLATLGLSDVAPVSFGDLERAALADVIAAYLKKTAPEACPADRGTVRMGAAAKTSASLGRIPKTETALGSRNRKALRDDSSSVFRDETLSFVDDGVVVEVVCESSGEKDSTEEGKSETFAASLSGAPRAAAKAMGAGAASGALRAAMVDAGFRVGDRVYVVDA